MKKNYVRDKNDARSLEENHNGVMIGINKDGRHEKLASMNNDGTNYCPLCLVWTVLF